MQFWYKIRYPLATALMALSVTLVTGCEDLGDGDSVRSNDQGFPPSDDDGGSGPGFDDSNPGGQTGTGGSDGPAQNELRVTVQVPAGIVEGDPGRRNLVSTTDASLRVARVNANLGEEPTQDALAPDISTEDGAFILTFSGLNSVPSDVDLIVSATVNGNTFRSPLAAASGNIQLNPFTDFLVSEVIGENLDSGDISRIKDCEETLCTEGLIWAPLVDQVQNFEIEIPDNRSPQQTRTFLDNRADFADFVNQAARALKLDQQRIGSLGEDGLDTNTTSFNTVYFATSLNLDRTQSTPFWASRTITRGESSNDDGTGFSFPSLTLTSFDVEFVDLDVTSLALNVPYVRNSGTFSDIDGVTNTHSTSPGSAFVRDANTLIAGRPVLQSLTESGSTTVGWAPDPHFFAGYLLGDAADPEALMGSYFQAGQTIALTETGNGGFTRQETREEQATANLELNLPEWKEEDGSELQPASGGNYNMIGFELVPSDTMDGSPMRVRATLGDWNLSGTGGDALRANEDTTTDGSVSWTLDSGTVVNNNGTDNPFEESADIDRLPVSNSTDDPADFRGHILYNHDSVELQDVTIPDEAGGPAPNGAISPDNRWIGVSARTANNADTDTGDFVRIAYAPSQNDRLEEVEAENRTYRLVGFEVVLDDDEESLRQINGSCLQAGGGETLLFEEGVEVFRNPSATNSYEAPTRFENDSVSLGPIPEKQPRFAVQGGGTELRGYVADEGNTLVMLKKTDQSLGLLMGFQEDDPKGCTEG